MQKKKREKLNPNRGIKTKILSLVFLVIGGFVLKTHAHAFVSNEQEKCSYLTELKEKPIQEFAKGLDDIPSKCITEKLCRLLDCPNTRKTND